MDLTRWEPHAYRLLQMGAAVCGFGGPGYSLRAFPLCASRHDCLGSHGIHSVKSKKSSFLYAQYEFDPILLAVYLYTQSLGVPLCETG